MQTQFVFHTLFATKDGVQSGYLVFGKDSVRLANGIGSASCYPLNPLKIAAAAVRAIDRVAESFEVLGGINAIAMVPVEVYPDPEF